MAKLWTKEQEPECKNPELNNPLKALMINVIENKLRELNSFWGAGRSNLETGNTGWLPGFYPPVLSGNATFAGRIGSKPGLVANA